MCLSSKTTLLFFWIFCIICVTFAPKSRDPGKELVDQFNTLTIKGNIWTYEIVREENDSASASSSVDDAFQKWCDENEKDLGCEGAINTVFKNSEARRNFKDGFYNMNKDSFNKDNTNYKYRYGYYEDLVNKATQLETSNILSPKQFCEKKYNKKQDDCIENIKKIKDIEDDTAGLEAFKIVYFNLDVDMLNFNHFFPDWAPDKKQYESREEYVKAYKEANKSHKIKLDFIRQYFYHLFMQSNFLNEKNLRTPQQYCQKEFPE